MSERYNLSVIIPTFNEEENIAAIIGAVNDVCSKNGIQAEILVVDDNSNDRTIPIVQDIVRRCENVRLISADERPWPIPVGRRWVQGSSVGYPPGNRR